MELAQIIKKLQDILNYKENLDDEARLWLDDCITDLRKIEQGD